MTNKEYEQKMRVWRQREHEIKTHAIETVAKILWINDNEEKAIDISNNKWKLPYYQRAIKELGYDTDVKFYSYEEVTYD